MSPNKEETVRVNLNFKERHYDDDSMMHKAGYPIMCPAEGYVIIRNGWVSALVCARLVVHVIPRALGLWP